MNGGGLSRIDAHIMMIPPSQVERKGVRAVCLWQVGSSVIKELRTEYKYYVVQSLNYEH